MSEHGSCDGLAPHHGHPPAAHDAHAPQRPPIVALLLLTGAQRQNVNAMNTFIIVAESADNRDDLCA